MVKVQLLDLEMEMAGSNHLVKIIYFFLKLGYLYVFSFCLLGGVWGLDSSLSYGPELSLYWYHLRRKQLLSFRAKSATKQASHVRWWLSLRWRMKYLIWIMCNSVKVNYKSKHENPHKMLLQLYCNFIEDLKANAHNIAT